MKLQQATELYLEEGRCRHLAESTLKNHRRRLTHFVHWCDIHSVTDPREATLQTLLDYHLWLRRKKRSDGCPLAAHTVNLAMLTVKHLFKRLAVRNLILEDIGQDFPALKEPKTLPRSILTREQAMQLLQQPNLSTPLGFRDRAMLELLYSTGLRGAELCALLLHDLDLPARLARVIQGKGRKDRVVPLGKVAAGYVAEYIRSVRPVLVGDGGSAAVFLSATGRTLEPKALLRIVKTYRDKARLPDTITTHSLRHTCATELLKGGASIRHVQELLGHAHITTTQIYTRVVPIDLKKAHARTAPSERRRDAETVRFDPSQARWKDTRNAGAWQMFRPRKDVKKNSESATK